VPTEWAWFEAVSDALRIDFEHQAAPKGRALTQSRLHISLIFMVWILK
jgi:hypothetical protein